ncbi:MAG: Serine/threonine-protein kinase B (plasmid) [Chroococcopsis gigantea SAG 12.99]|jgi:uncharacterized protein YjbI with pentapeptide repeats|nr:Serine/threonine-protein kinase B [Chroococcopsis gigantea SAG 12.99]
MDREELLKKYAAGERDFTGVDLSSADLRNIDLCEVDFTRANFSHADLRGASITILSTLYCVNFIGADLREAYIAADLRNADFTDADLRGAGLHGDACGADFTRTNFTGADFTAFPEGARLHDTIMPDGEVVVGPIYFDDWHHDWCQRNNIP